LKASVIKSSSLAVDMEKVDFFLEREPEVRAENSLVLL
jgi:hypothetical protein